MNPLLDFWEQALAAEFGVKIACPQEERRLFRQQLYAVRAESADPRFVNLVIALPKDEDFVWIVERNADERAKAEGQQ